MSTIDHHITLSPAVKGQRLDQALAILLPQYSRSRLKNWIQSGQILVNGTPKPPKEIVQGNEKVVIHATVSDILSVQPEKIDLPIIFEDEEIMIINKPAGMVVHPGAGISAHTMQNALLYYAPSLAEVPRSGIIHRLDKETSGLLLIAKSLSSHTYLVQELQKRKIAREYQAIVVGSLISGGSVNAPIGRNRVKRTQMAVTSAGKSAITHYRLIEKFQHYTFLLVKLETGRTHQIRVHMAHLKHPLVGDPLYGGRLRLPPQTSSELLKKLKTFKRQALHACRLTLVHPKTHQTMVFEAPLPTDMQQLLMLLQQSDKSEN